LMFVIVLGLRSLGWGFRPRARTPANRLKFKSSRPDQLLQGVASEDRSMAER